MKIHTVRIVVILGMLLVGGHVWASPPEKDRLQAQGQTADGMIVKVTVATAAYSKTIPYNRNALWWGAESTTPKTIVSMIDVQVGRKKLQIPLSAYSDLSNPSEVSVASTNQGFNVTIRGGDAAASYKAVLGFENGLIRRRKVASMEFPDEAWEETNYSFNINDK
jgi:hypothetical protein